MKVIHRISQSIIEQVIGGEYSKKLTKLTILNFSLFLMTFVSLLWALQIDLSVRKDSQTVQTPIWKILIKKWEK